MVHVLKGTEKYLLDIIQVTQKVEWPHSLVVKDRGYVNHLRLSTGSTDVFDSTFQRRQLQRSWAFWQHTFKKNICSNMFYKEGSFPKGGCKNMFKTVQTSRYLSKHLLEIIYPAIQTFKTCCWLWKWMNLWEPRKRSNIQKGVKTQEPTFKR